MIRALNYAHIYIYIQCIYESDADSSPSHKKAQVDVTLRAWSPQTRVNRAQLSLANKHNYHDTPQMAASFSNSRAIMLATCTHTCHSVYIDEQ